MIPSERGCQLSSHIESSLHMLTAQQKSTTQVLRKGMNPNQPTNQPKDKHSAGNLQCPRNQPPKEFLLANKTWRPFSDQLCSLQVSEFLMGDWRGQGRRLTGLTWCLFDIFVWKKNGRQNLKHIFVARWFCVRFSNFGGKLVKFWNNLNVWSVWVMRSGAAHPQRYWKSHLILIDPYRQIECR